VNLTEFLLARIAEDEQDARDASFRSADWAVAERRAVWGEDLDDTVLADGKPLAELPGPGCSLAAEHIVRWAPARVLAECEARRRIVTDVAPDVDSMSSAYVDATDEGADWPAERLLRLLAVPYADHPDYLDEWKPM
jgi:hypothetical protein